MALAHVARLAAATVLVAAAGTLLAAPPAGAATCSSDTGVSVVVDGTGLGGGIVTSCVADGGGDTAGALFEVHHDLTRASQFPGAVCRVDDAPADAECRNMPPADAYWGLFWSDGSGGWVYSSQGVDSLDVPDGGSVAFAWQDGGDQDAPGVAPPQNDEEPSSSPTPSSGGGSGGGGGGGGNDSGGASGGGGTTGGGSTTAPSATPTASPSSSAGPGRGGGSGGGSGKATSSDGAAEDEGKGKSKGKGKGGDGRGEDRDDEESEQPTEDASATADAVLTAEPPTDAGEDGLPTWVAPVGIAGLFGVAAVVALLRRRSAG